MCRFGLVSRFNGVSLLDWLPASFSHEFMAGRDEDLPFRIELWDDGNRHVEELIALAADFTTAQTAYNERSEAPAGKLITLRQKARLIKKSR